MKTLRLRTVVNKENFDEWQLEYNYNNSVLSEIYIMVNAIKLDKTVSLKILIDDHDYAFSTAVCTLR